MTMPYFSTSRLIFKDSPTSDAETYATERPGETRAALSMADSEKNAEKALKEAKDEQANIERSYGKPDSRGELPNSAPPEIRNLYKELTTTINDLNLAIQQRRGIVQTSLDTLQQIFNDLQDYADKAQNEAQPGDPMASLPYAPLPKQANQQKQPNTQPEAKANRKPNQTETVDEANERRVGEFCARFEDGNDNVTAEEAKMFRKILKPNELYIFTAPAHDNLPEHQYEIEISKDNKWIRVTSRAAEKSGASRYTRVLPLEEGLTGQPEFALQTDEEAISSAIEKNKQATSAKLAWLETDEAPLGTSLILFTKIETRKNDETGNNERFMRSFAVRKGTDGLRFATLEVPIDNNNQPLGTAKEVKSDKVYTKEKALAMVSENAPRAYEGTNNDRKAEIKRSLDALGYQLIGQLPLGGEKSPNFQQTLRALNEVLTRYNVKKWRYRDSIIHYLTVYANGQLTIYDPSKKNPDYVSPNATPNLPQYKIHAGPIDMSKYATENKSA
jgi:hypothetical protein